MAAKKIAGYIKLQVPAGKANPSPPIGPALGQRGLNIMEFCKAFNAKTSGPEFEVGMPIPVVITAYQDKTFTFIMKQPPMTYWVKKFAGITSGSKKPGYEGAGKIKMSDIEKIAQKKLVDTNSNDPEAVKQQIIGSARSMGIQVVEG